MAALAVTLDPTQRGIQARNFQQSLEDKIVGQSEAVNAVADVFQLYEAGLHAPGRPVGNLLFLGPTGSGKTRVVEAAAEILFGDPRAMIRVDCAEFQHSHEIAKLIGSPPGYLGHRETHPLITQESLARFHTEKIRLSFLLLDEIEKASDALWQLLLGVMDKASLTLGDNRRVDLSQTVIFLTSNLGAAEMTNLSEPGIGFACKPSSAARLDGQVARVGIEAARRKFSPEFMNRLDKIVVFRSLDSSDLERILDLELAQVRQRLCAGARSQIDFRLGAEARGFLLHEGVDTRYGARHLKRSIERHFVCPLANLIASEQIVPGDRIAVDYDLSRAKLVFSRDAERVFLLPPSPQPARAANAGSAGIPLAEPAAVPAAVIDAKPRIVESSRARRRDS